MFHWNTNREINLIKIHLQCIRKYSWLCLPISSPFYWASKQFSPKGFKGFVSSWNEREMCLQSIDFLFSGIFPFRVWCIPVIQHKTCAKTPVFVLMCLLGNNSKYSFFPSSSVLCQQKRRAEWRKEKKHWSSSFSILSAGRKQFFPLRSVFLFVECKPRVSLCCTLIVDDENSEKRLEISWFKLKRENLISMRQSMRKIIKA
jgi:hypothetical protein